ncbi:MAG TPA: LipL32 family surface lipoprotein [Bacteroidia bacterium]|nr:LipL32 family surface lipoprotein [Bacteroidia bacterium]HNT79987.1 LipL32 family surface lipoprotein [Bacteroidia bacterium]
MSRFPTVLLLTLLGISIQSLNAQRLDYFGMEYGKTDLGNGIFSRIRFNEIASYFDFIEKNDARYFQRNKRGEIVLYFLLNDTVEELAVRAISPIPHLASPRSGNIASDSYIRNENKKQNGFDTEILLERYSGSRNPSVLNTPTDDWKWDFVDANGGIKPGETNSEIRLVQYDTESENQIIPGLYKISVTQHAGSELFGSLLVEVGCTKSLVHPKLSADLRDFSQFFQNEKE